MLPRAFTRILVQFKLYWKNCTMVSCAGPIEAKNCSSAGMLNRSLHSRILILIVSLISVGVILSIFWELRNKERELLDEKLRASRIMAQPILTAIYKDMLEEKADMAIHLINSIGKSASINSVYIVRSNGVEEAFRDMKTINAVREEAGEVKPEWTTDHLDEKVNKHRGA